MIARRSISLGALALASVGLVASPARAGNTLAIVDTKLDPPTLISLGVQVLISGDDNHDARITIRYRKAGSVDWKDGMPLFRVRPEVVAGKTVPQQFAGSLFDLAPDTAYDLELHAVDPDGLDKTVPITGKTRAVPRKDPKTPRAVSVKDVGGFNAALAGAKAGDVITLAKGTYSGQFSMSATGTADNPIVIRGEDIDAAIIDGGGCNPCNMFEIFGSFVTIERLTMQNGERSVRWQTPGAEGNVLRRVHIKNVRLGIGGKQDQKNFYICDNIVEGRIKWPLTYGDDGAAKANDDGLVVSGSGMVVCHNTISGFADALQNFQDGTRGNDFYGNDILWTYDDGIELDGSEGNSRCFRNRFTNTFDTLSYQPIIGGPVYTFRNVIVNVAGEGMKLHALGGTPPQEPVGELIFHNTFVKSGHAIQLSTPNVAHYYQLANNLFLGAPTDGLVVSWDTPIDFTTGSIDYDGYFPEGKFMFGYGATGATYDSFAAVVAAGRYEKHGVLLDSTTFASGLSAPADHKPLLPPQNAALSPTSKAIDKGVVLPNVTDGYKGAAPDLGALELGCAAPIFGPRPVGMDESNEPVGCAGSVEPPGDSGVDSGDASGDDSGGVDAFGDGSSGDDVGQNGAAPSSDAGGCGCKIDSSGSDESGGRSSLVALIAMCGAVLLRRRRV